MRFFKWAAACLVALAVTGSAIIGWTSRDIAATHPTLTRADLPPLIPVRDFYADLRAEWGYTTDAQGEYIAWRAAGIGEEQVKLARLSDRQEILSLNNVQHHFFDRASQHLMVVRKGRLWRIDPTQPDEDSWTDVTPRGFRGWHISVMPENPDQPWIITSSDRNPALGDLYTTNQNGGDKRLLVENEGQTLNWVLDADQTPRLRLDKDSPGEISLKRNHQDTWAEVLRLSINDTFHVFELAPDGQSALALSSRGRDKTALVRLDLNTGTERLLYQDPDEDLLSLVNLDHSDGKVDAVLTRFGKSEVIGLTKRGQTLARLIADFGKRVDVNMLDTAPGGRFATATLSPDGQSYVYVLLDLEQGTSQQLGEFSFRKRWGAALAQSTEVTLPARDGMMLHGVLTRPKGATGPIPTVLEVHGGPAQHVRWEYHHFRQFLANRGYAVLALNFRGSHGLGKAYQQAGFGQVGRAMQDDLVDAAQWLVEQGIADPQAIAINGISYGGYASALAMLRDAGTFQTAIVEHAPLDLPYQMRNNPFSWGLTPEYTQRYFGDPKDPGDLKAMQQVSPITLVDKLDAPMLLIAGKHDRIVGFEQTEAFADKAHELGKDVTMHVFEREGHGLYHWQSRITQARMVEDHLAQHLGGRSGGWDWIELAVKWFTN